jgi:small subunit ribosomal protein S20
LRTFIKKVIAAVNAGDKEKAQAAYNTAVPVIDSAVNKGLIHKNKAARSKSRLNAKVKALA